LIELLAHLFVVYAFTWLVLCSGSLVPVVAYDKNGIKILFHFGKDRPRRDVQVMAVSMMSTNTSPIKNFSFQAAVPKVLQYIQLYCLYGSSVVCTVYYF